MPVERDRVYQDFFIGPYFSCSSSWRGFGMVAFQELRYAVHLLFVAYDSFPIFLRQFLQGLHLGNRLARPYEIGVVLIVGGVRLEAALFRYLQLFAAPTLGGTVVARLQQAEGP